MLELEPETYADATVLALIDVESDGDPDARRTTKVKVKEGGPQEDAFFDAVVSTVHRIPDEDDPDTIWLEGRVPSQFCGLLQMGELAGLDVGFERKGFRGWDTTAPLLGNGRLSIEKFYEYQERYRKRTHRQPTRVAILWKGGPGTAKTVKEELNDGATLSEAIDLAADEHDIPRLAEYVERFREGVERWSHWLEAQGDPVEACFPVD